MSAKSSQLQIRVSAAEKREIQRRAELEGRDVSSWVLEKLLPPPHLKFQSIIESENSAKYMLAELNDHLAGLSSASFTQAVAVRPGKRLPAELENYIAAMVEVAAAKNKIKPPEWVDEIQPLTEPYFASELKSLRLHLLTVSPPPFRRRNIFVDATVGDRV